MSDTVRQTTGGQAQRYSFALPGQAAVYSTTTTNNSAPIPKDGLHSAYSTRGTTSAGALGGTVSFYATIDPHTAGADDSETGERNNFAIATTNASATITSAEGLFRSNMDGDEVYAVGVTVGTTMTYVSATSATLSAVATATGTPQARFQALDWIILGTVTLAGTRRDSGGFATMVAWKWTRMVVSAISGTNATIYGRQGV